MSIEKKSLINTLKTTKKANVASSEVSAKPSSVNSKRSHNQVLRAGPGVRAKRGVVKRNFSTLRAVEN